MPQHDYYVSYDGSLTTPNCDESVKWLIFDKQIQATDAQVRKI